MTEKDQRIAELEQDVAEANACTEQLARELAGVKMESVAITLSSLNYCDELFKTLVMMTKMYQREVGLRLGVLPDEEEGEESSDDEQENTD